jgi:hypothetical protein
VGPASENAPVTPTTTVLGHRAERHYERMLTQLGPHLEAGEIVMAFFQANRLRTLVNIMACGCREPGHVMRPAGTRE